VVGQVEQRVVLAVDAQRPALAPAGDARRFAPSRQAPEEWLGPEVLVDVDAGGRGGWRGAGEAVQ
jgi:hypothetical protein